MTNFSHLKKLDVTDKTVDYPIYQIEGEPTLVLKSAGETNKPYFNSVLKQSRRKTKALQIGTVNKKMIEENRAEDRELFPKFVIVDWKDMKDGKGKDVPFSVENCAEFLEALPDWIFDELRTFATTSANFVDYSMDIEEKAKN